MLFELVWILLNTSDFWSKDIDLNQHSMKSLHKTIVLFSFLNMFLLCGLILLTIVIAKKGFNNHHRPFNKLWDFEPADKRYLNKEKEIEDQIL